MNIDEKTLLQKAKNTLNKLDELGLGNPDYYDDISFDIQQIIEKTLKYLLQLKGIKYKPVHNLDYLLDQLNNPAMTTMLEQYCLRLNSFEAKSRYFDDFYVSRHELEKMLGLAKEVIAYTEAQEREFLLECEATLTTEFEN